MLTNLRDFAASMAGRFFAVLSIGIIASALIAATLAGIQRQRDAAATRLDRIVDRISDVVLADPPAPADRHPDQLPAAAAPDVELTQRLRERFDWASVATAFGIDRSNCRPDPTRRVGPPPPPAQMPVAGDFNQRCYAIQLAGPSGPPTLFTVEAPPYPKNGVEIFSPMFVGVLVACALALAAVVARMAARPIARLGTAAAVLAGNLDAPLLAVTGPSDVRLAITAFNRMQADLQRTLDERTQMLAAISHDLRSPLTRLRLRLEAVPDGRLRDKLIADAVVMGELIEEGLDLARTASSSEAIAPVDLNALLQSTGDDAEDTGQTVTFQPSQRVVLLTRPGALRRVVTNLVDNAVRYAGAAEIIMLGTTIQIQIIVADRGPGIEADQLERIFDPFVRVENSRSTETGGTGLGLTIARMLAQQINASISLSNCDGGGLLAILSIRRLRNDPGLQSADIHLA